MLEYVIRAIHPRVVIAFAHFQNSYKLAQSRSAAAIGTNAQEGDDFYE